MILGSGEVRSRPLKLAYLVDPNNGQQVREAIRLSSTLWGGTYFPIVPLYKRIPNTWRSNYAILPKPEDVILGLVEAFDPDVLVQFSERLPDFISKTGLRVISPSAIWSPLTRQNPSHSPVFGIGIFEILGDIFKKHFMYSSRYRLRLVFPRILDAKLSLFWASWFGEIPARVASIIESDYSESLEIESPDVRRVQVSEMLTEDVWSPLRTMQYGISLRDPLINREAYVFCLDATKVSDVVDFWNLRAMGASVIPVPMQYKDSADFRASVDRFFSQNGRPHWAKKDLVDGVSVLVARSGREDWLAEYMESLSAGQDFKHVNMGKWYPSVWDEWSREKAGEIPAGVYGDDTYSMDIRDSRTVTLRSAFPAFADMHGLIGEPRCANEVNFRFYEADEFLAEAFPRSSGREFTRAISGITSYRDWRVGRNGLVKLIASDFGETREIPTAQQVFFSWLEDLGWKPDLSTPGSLAKQIIKRLAGNVRVLKAKKLLDLLERMNGGPIEPGQTRRKNQRQYRREAQGQRDLSISEVKNRLRERPGNDSLHDYLISRGVFQIGPSSKCPNCGRWSWLPLESVRDEISCPKCLNKYSAIGSLPSSEWRYRTAGPFSVPKYADGAYSVLLALEFLGGGFRFLRTSSVLSFRAVREGKDIEADLAMFWGEDLRGGKEAGLLFGECKTYNRFEKDDFERMRYLAESFLGSCLVFSTLRSSLTRAEVAGISRIAKAGRRHWKAEKPVNPVMVLTATELFSKVSPPHCWEDEVRKGLSYSAGGILGLCDATQQIHLGLKPWFEEWSQRRRKVKRRR